MEKTRIQIAKRDILDYLSNRPPILKLSDLKAILSSQRQFWRLAQRTNTKDFIEFLGKEGELKEIHFPFPHREETRYVWGEVSLLEVLLSLRPGCYFSHYTAVRMQGLTEQIPKTIYLNHEQHLKSQSAGGLEQGRIDAAFSRVARTSNNAVDFGHQKIYLLNGKNTNQLGVVEETVSYDTTDTVQVRLTNIERTLIDITVRPIYAGGIFEVQKAFQLAKDRVSVNALAAMIKKIDHTYPYHQAIGYYMEKAGYKSTLLDLIRRFPMEYDFYLANQLGETQYIREWRLHVPKGF